MKRNIYYLSLFLLSSCLTQAPAPTEFKSSKQSGRPGYSESTKSSLSDSSEGITSREISGQKDYRPTGELSEKNETLEESEEKPFETVKALEEKDISREDKRLQSLEEEMDELEAKDTMIKEPSNKKSADKKPIAKEQVEENQEHEVVRPNKISTDESHDDQVSLKFTMPVSGKITIKFGEEVNGKKSSGINIAAAKGTSVQSIASGKVVYAGEDSKFGNLVIIKIGSTEMFAAYAHMDDLLLQKDDDVTKGQVIGHASSSELHFALRSGKTPVDPMPYLRQSKN